MDIRAALERVTCEGHVIGDEVPTVGWPAQTYWLREHPAGIAEGARSNVWHYLVGSAYRNHRATFLVAMALEMVGAQRQQENNWDRHADQPK